MGQKYAAYDVNGAILGFYDSYVSPAPQGATTLALTDAQWQACISTPGYTVVNGALVAPPAAPVPTAAQLLAAAQAQQVATLSAACGAAIVAGFSSSALGAPYTYPAKTTDQLNLVSSIADSQLAMLNAVPWSAGAQIAGNQTTVANGAVYKCIVPGVSGAAAPVWPTAVDAIANDGGAQWQLWTTPFWCEDGNGSWAWRPHTVSQIQQAGTDGKAAVLALQAKNAGFAAQVAAATTIAEVQAVVWA